MAQILVVDDDPDLRGLVEFRLRKAGHQVLAAGDGAIALAAVRERDRPDLAILDVAMPGMSGLELLVALRSARTCRSCPRFSSAPASCRATSQPDGRSARATSRSRSAPRR
jgi:CheY-like chemotaxis protein